VVGILRSADDRVDGPAPHERVSNLTRGFVWIFLTAFVLCGVVGIEAWPLTGWRLFSHLRTERQTAWQAVAVDDRGVERPIPVSNISPKYRGFVQLMQGFDADSDHERTEVCDAWRDAAVTQGGTVVQVRLYLRSWDALPRDGDRPAEPARRSLRYTCSDAGATAVTGDADGG
jgi:hypothetical protein